MKIKGARKSKGMRYTSKKYRPPLEPEFLKIVKHHHTQMKVTALCFVFMTDDFFNGEIRIFFLLFSKCFKFLGLNITMSYQTWLLCPLWVFLSANWNEKWKICYLIKCFTYRETCREKYVGVFSLVWTKWKSLVPISLFYFLH